MNSALQRVSDVVDGIQALGAFYIMNCLAGLWNGLGRAHFWLLGAF